MHRMSISQIAQAAKVSYATAWRIINNRPCRSEQAVAAVRAAMNRIGYAPNAPGTSRRGRRPKAADGIRSHNIALLHLRESSSIGTSVLAYVQRMLAERNLNLIFAHVERADAMPQAVRVGNVDGILGYGEFPAQAMSSGLQRVPAVWMMSRFSASTTDAWGDRVRPDHQEIGRIAAQRLIERGYRDLAYFNPDPEQSFYFERGIAFRTVAEQAIAQGKADSITMMTAKPLIPATSSSSIVPINSFAAMESAAEQFVSQWLTTAPRPTGVFVPVDRVTLRVYRHLQQHRLRVGADIQIISCDNEAEMLSLMDPPPESIDLNRKAVARLAVERLLWRMKNGPAAPSVVITVSPALASRSILQPAATTTAAAAGSSFSATNIDKNALHGMVRRDNGQQQSPATILPSRSLS
jgi:DNA-binding LacI/PurR family transcriptional regulator